MSSSFWVPTFDADHAKADEKIEANLREALDQGFRHFKLKVGIDLEGDKRRLGMIRRVAGDDVVIMVSHYHSRPRR